MQGAAVLSRAANLWPYLPVKSIQVSESRAECAGGQLEGSTSGPLPPPGPLLGGHLPVSSHSISSARPLPFLSATKSNTHSLARRLAGSLASWLAR